LWFALLATLGVLVTCAVFAVFVPGPERGKTFYIAASIVCCAVVAFFAHLTHSRLAVRGVPTATPPARIQVQFLSLLWLVSAIIAAAVAADPKHADTFYADRVFMIYLVLTILSFVGAYFIYTKDIEVEDEDRGLAEERRDILFNVPDIETVMHTVQEAGRQHPEHALLADRACKRLDTVRSALESILVSATASAQGQNWNAEIAGQITKLISLSRLPGDAAETSKALDDIARQADVILSVVRKRERALMA
jgi:hypothetical protein